MLDVKPSWNFWRLLTDNGKHIWAYKPQSEDLARHLDSVADFKNTVAEQFASDFNFNKTKNPNSADQVFRHQRINQHYQPYSGKTAETATEKDQPTIDALIKGIHYFTQLQTEDGHWPGDYGGPMFLLPGLLIAAYISGTPFPKPHREMMQLYILNHQNSDGGWSMHIEGQSTMFGSVMQYVSLRILDLGAEHNALAKARNWIKTHGGATGIPSWGKFYLALLNLYDWEGFNSLFPEMWLLPKWLPLHPWRYWCHSRMVYLPMAYCYAQRIQMPENALILSLRKEIYSDNYVDIPWHKQRDKVCPEDIYTKQSPILKWMNFFTNGYEKFCINSIRKKALRFILDYIHAEDQQTEYLDIGPVSQAINSICIWHAHGNESTEFKRHVERWYDYLWVAEDGMKMCGYNGSQLWDTAFTTRAILESEIAKNFAASLEQSYRFIDHMQILQEHSTHEQYYRHPMIGSWPFSTAEQGWPVADCTAEGLSATLAIHASGLVEEKIDEQRILAAVKVILSYQNHDGGWATYETQRAPAWLEKLNPSEIFADIMADYSWTECSAACVIALIETQERYPDYQSQTIKEAVSQGLQFILRQQAADGSWYGGWGVCFTYATWFAVEALSKARGLNYIDETSITNSLTLACTFLKSKQMSDGGWGETFESCSNKVYSQAQTSQVVNTAWALLALMSADVSNQDTIDQGIALLIKRQTTLGDWEQENISGVFNYNCMITYSNYRNIFPIWALNRYFKLFLCYNIKV